MQEIALFLSSIAGMCTAAAVKRFPRNKAQLASLGTNSNIRNQINSLQIEREVLTKTITRLYQNDACLGKIQRDKLLSRYQYQLGIILAKIDKLEAASKHPDLGPVGEGLITLMDQKLSQLDKSLYELSSKITIANSQIPEKESPKPKQENKKVKITVEEKIPEKPKPQVIAPTIHIPPPKPAKPVELTTLTEISTKPPQFPLFEPKPIQPKHEVEEIPKPQQKVPEKIEIIQTTSSIPKIKPVPSQQVAPEVTPTSIPQENSSEPVVKLPEEEKIEDEDDLTKIKGEIMKTLSRLEQAEVE